jgi:predicted small lipoprotein YifL
MKRLITIIMLLTLPLYISACGVKRDLKLPSEIQKKEQKKQEGGNI